MEVGTKKRRRRAQPGKLGEVVLVDCPPQKGKAANPFSWTIGDGDTSLIEVPFVPSGGHPDSTGQSDASRSEYYPSDDDCSLSELNSENSSTASQKPASTLSSGSSSKFGGGGLGPRRGSIGHPWHRRASQARATHSPSVRFAREDSDEGTVGSASNPDLPLDQEPERTEELRSRFCRRNSALKASMKCQMEEDSPFLTDLRRKSEEHRELLEAIRENERKLKHLRESFQKETQALDEELEAKRAEVKHQKREARRWRRIRHEERQRARTIEHSMSMTEASLSSCSTSSCSQSENDTEGTPEDITDQFVPTFDGTIVNLAELKEREPLSKPKRGGSGKDFLEADGSDLERTASRASTRQPSRSRSRDPDERLPSFNADQTKHPAPKGEVCLVFTDVQDSTWLWNQNPTAMKESLALHNKILRDQISDHAGYEVKTEGDAFMIAFASPSDALGFCTDAQSLLVKAEWPPELLELKGQTSTPDGLWSGLRVRMGMHMGRALCEEDPTTGRMDYFGPIVNRAARVAGKAHGGEILLSSEAKQALDMLSNWDGRLCDLLKKVVLTSLGCHELKGFEEGHENELFRCLSRSLAGRDFPSDPALAPENPVVVVEPAPIRRRASFVLPHHDWSDRGETNSTSTEEEANPPSPTPWPPLTSTLDPAPPTEKPDSQTIFVAFSFERSSELWAEQPQAMSEAVQTYTKCVCALASEYSGVQVSSFGEKSLWACARFDHAANFALALQEGLLKEEWPPSLRSPAAYAPHHADRPDPSIWNGPRVGCAIHCGHPNVVANGDGEASYHGEVVNTIPLMLQCAKGGEILLSREAQQLAQKSRDSTFGEKLSAGAVSISEAPRRSGIHQATLLFCKDDPTWEEKHTPFFRMFSTGLLHRTTDIDTPERTLPQLRAVAPASPAPAPHLSVGTRPRQGGNEREIGPHHGRAPPPLRPVHHQSGGPDTPTALGTPSRSAAFEQKLRLEKQREFERVDSMSGAGPSSPGPRISPEAPRRSIPALPKLKGAVDSLPAV